MLKSSIRIASLLVLSAAVTVSTAEAQFGLRGGGGGGGGGGAPRAAPSAPRMAPQMSAPRMQMSAPRMAPRLSAPRMAPQMPRALPRQFARPSGGPSPSVLSRQRVAPKTWARPLQQRQHFGGRIVEGKSGALKLRRDLAGPRRQGTAPSVALGRLKSQPNEARQAFRRLNGPNRPVAARSLSNQFFAKRQAGGVDGRLLARATFQGSFAGNHWSRHHHKHHRHFRPIIVIGWLGPLFWPFAYDDFIGYTYYPYAYDAFWPFVYDDVYEGMFGRYAYAPGSAYAAVGRGGGARSNHARSVSADVCSGQTAGLTDFPIEQIAQTVAPDDAQRAALDGLKDATARALDILKAACPTELPSTPTGRLEAMRARLAAMLEAVRIVRPALENFYQSLNDEQKARFNAIGPDSEQQQSRRDLAQSCNERASGIASLPLDRIDRAVRPDDAQRASLSELRDANARASDLLKTDCPTYRALTPVGRLEAMEQRLDAMLRAVETVQPVLDRFYGSLSDEQKERFNRLSPAQS